MSRLDKTTEATLRMLQGPAPSGPALNVVPTSEPTPPAASPRPKAADTSARTMVYLPAAWKEKFREIAYHERRKENDLSLEAFRDFLLKKGHKVAE
jgi:hypothetical protein